GGGAPRTGPALPQAARAADPAAAAHADPSGLPDDPEDRRAALLELVTEHAAAVLGLTSATALRPGRQLTEAGIDSLTAVELRNRLNAATGLRLPATVLFDHPTPDALAAALASRMAGDDTAGDHAAPTDRTGTGPGTGGEPGPGGGAPPDGRGIDAMSLDDLVDLALTDDATRFPDSR
ncbi:acyl carrier protein, partial [Streptomonospora salina]